MHIQLLSGVLLDVVQVLTGSHDCTVRLWDLAAGKTKAVLTNHKKSVRALAMHPSESALQLINLLLVGACLLGFIESACTLNNSFQFSKWNIPAVCPT